MPARHLPLLDVRDIPAGLGLLTRLPVRVNSAHAMARGAAAAWAWPLAGVVVAGCAAVAGLGTLSLGLAPGIAAGATLAVQIVVTGALHEDGLADCADGFWGGWTRARRLEIMADSRIGAYGVLALILVVGLAWQALAQMMAAQPVAWVAWLAAAAMLSRAAMGWTMASLPRARWGGLSARVGRPTRRTAVTGAAVALGGSVLVLGPEGLLAGGIAALVCVWLGRLALDRIGGQTGDVLGGVQSVTALAVLVTGAGVLG